ncbi:8-oxo-dGTP diphosphatase [bacterium]|nr:8-oxo-dGTP diphosphatase [bacterium]
MNNTVKLLTLVVILSKDRKRILLGMKKRGFGVGRWNGFGGKLIEGETIDDAAHREVTEEIGIKMNKLERHGVITFYEADPIPLEVTIFSCDDFSGEPKESDEMKPKWFPINSIPYEEMWPDDKYWLPLLIDGKKFKGKFWFKDKNNTHKITHYELKRVSKI